MKINSMKFMLLAFAAAVTVSCSEKGPEGGDGFAEPVDLKMSIARPSVVMGEELEITFKTAAEGEKANEDFAITLTATESNKDVAAEYFDNFPARIQFAKGESEITATIPVKKTGIKGNHTVTIAAVSRGYKIDGANQNITVSDYHYIKVALENNTENVVAEGGKFIITASLQVPAAKEVSVNITPAKGEEGYYENLPEKLTIAEGETSVKSSEITMKADDGGYEEKTLVLELVSSLEETYPLESKTLSIKRNDVNEPLGTLLEDERHVYPKPADAYVSSKNKAAVETWNGCTFIVAEKNETTHPTRPGYTLLNAMEFHYVDAMMRGAKVNQPNEYGVRPPLGLAAQNTAKVQETMAVVIDKFSTITPEGYLKMWAAKDKNTATGGDTKEKEYGTAAFYASKFNPDGMNDNSGNAPMHTRIYPGTRAEARIRVGGEHHGFNCAFWFQGNNNIGGSGTPWPTCGEIDVMENPVGPGASGNAAWQTFHMGNREGKETNNNTSGAVKIDMTKWNIFWFEWSDDGNKVTLGINGKENVSLTRKQVEDKGGVWAFDKKENPNGLHMILTLVGPSAWALPNPPADWDKGFADISYEESKTNPKTPRMEIDWIRFYKSAGYSDDGKKYNTYLYF